MQIDKKFTGHFFASNFGEWKCDTDLPELIKFITKSCKQFSKNTEFVLYFVPVSIDAVYEISNYAPVFPGVVYLGRFTTI